MSGERSRVEETGDFFAGKGGTGDFFGDDADAGRFAKGDEDEMTREERERRSVG